MALNAAPAQPEGKAYNRQPSPLGAGGYFFLWCSANRSASTVPRVPTHLSLSSLSSSCWTSSANRSPRDVARERIRRTLNGALPGRAHAFLSVVRLPDRVIH